MMLLNESIFLLNEYIGTGREVNKLYNIILPYNKLMSSSPNIKQDKRLEYKFEINISFKIKNEKNENKQEVNVLLKEAIATEKFKEYVFENFNNDINKFNKYAQDEKYLSLELLPGSLKTASKNPYTDLWDSSIQFLILFDFPRWWADKIVAGKTSKSFFFKNFKIKYSNDLPYIVRYKTDNWKEISIQCIKYAIFNVSKLKDFIKNISKIMPNKEKVDFDISLNDSSKEIKLILVRGIIRWLSKFGIKPKYAKWITAGLTIYGILKLIQINDDEKDDPKRIKSKLKKFMR